MRLRPSPAREDPASEAAASFVVAGRDPSRVGDLLVLGGPSGLRGDVLDGDRSAWDLPVASALAATWDPELVRGLGLLVAADARRRGARGVVAPVVNLQRSPTTARHHALLSEDPLLAGRLAAALVAGVQEGGVAAVVGNLVARDGAANPAGHLARMTERTLREVHLAPFEAAVRAGAWAVLVGGALDVGAERAACGVHHELLGILREEWGFDGVALADGTLPCPPADALAAGLDTVLPGPREAWDPHWLAASVGAGGIPREHVERAARRIARLAERVATAGTLGPSERASSLRRRAAASAVVVLRSGGQLPAAAARLLKVAVVGVGAETVGAGLRRALPGARLETVEVEAERTWGRRSWPPAAPAPADLAAVARDPWTGSPGALIEVLDDTGRAVEAFGAWPGWDGWVRVANPEAASVRVTADLHLRAAGQHWVGAEVLGSHRVALDRRVVSTSSSAAVAEDVLGPMPGVLGFDTPRHPPLDLVGRGVIVLEPRRVRVEVAAQVVDLGALGRFARVLLRHRPPGPDLEEQIAVAEDAIEGADLAVVVVGREPEPGADRTSLGLPGRQDELVSRILAVRPDAVVVVTAGAPAILPWLDDAQTVLWAWPPSGAEWPDAIADVVLGRTEPSGRLPWTLPARVQDVPVLGIEPDTDGAVDYLEGVHVGYRSWELSGREPAAPFGHGLGWTEWAYESAAVAGEGDDGALLVDVRVRNVGARRGREVVQVYLEPVEDLGGHMPVRWLAGFASGEAKPGEAITLRVAIGFRSFQFWDEAGQDWALPPGAFRVRVGRSVRDLRLSI